MRVKNKEKARELAQASIFDNVELLGEWDGWRVYEPTINGDGECYIGRPRFILVSDTAARWADPDTEVRKIMRRFYPDDEDEEILPIEQK